MYFQTLHIRTAGPAALLPSRQQPRGCALLVCGYCHSQLPSECRAVALRSRSGGAATDAAASPAWTRFVDSETGRSWLQHSPADKVQKEPRARRQASVPARGRAVYSVRTPFGHALEHEPCEPANGTVRADVQDLRRHAHTQSSCCHTTEGLLVRILGNTRASAGYWTSCEYCPTQLSPLNL